MSYTSSSSSDQSSEEILNRTGNKDFVGKYAEYSIYLDPPTLPEIQYHELEFGEEPIGHGNYGTVWRGKCRQEICAIKELHLQEFRSKDEFSRFLNTFKKECEVILGMGGHPNIVRFMGVCLQVEHLCIVTELVDGGDLESLFKSANYLREFSLLKRLKMMKDIAQGMCWLHDREGNQIIHQDLKPSNILVTSDQTLKLCDFGLSTIYDRARDVLQGRVGSAIWMAPEALSEIEHDEKVDIFSWAIISWQILTGKKMPYKKYWISDSFEDLCEGKCVRKERPTIPEDTHIDIRNLLEESWAHNPEDRPLAKELCKRLTRCMIYCTIIDPEAARWWWRNWRSAVCFIYLFLFKYTGESTIR
eukprot:TRINITY_DN5260_c0_g1_i2.p1 TRINITY_DN5260_c0_g1~~TRINITY_DN5260_c0_g1_i2.p1  ORF type:complete len:375 (-),score=76.85 TRINITY_DN5260_c0_g1_i2:647-1726(-)